MRALRARDWLSLVAAAIALCGLISSSPAQQPLSEQVGVLALEPYNPRFAVDGLALGGAVYPDSAIYRAYNCRASDDFSGFTWCAVHHARRGKFGPYTSWVTILHSSANKAVFITQAIIPAFFRPGDVEGEIERLSRGFGQARVLSMEPRPGVPHVVLAAWGAVTLTPLDEQAMDALRRGEHIDRGLIAEFIGDAHNSARIGLPVYSIGGGPGFLWGASFDDTGKGSLRISAVDASALPHATPSPPEPAPPVPRPGPPPERNEVSSGSGFYVTHDGFILTNAHVVEGCAGIQVRTTLGTIAPARLLAKDPTNDLALLKVEATSDKVATFRFTPRLGEEVEAFGYPLAGILATSGNFSVGNITALLGLRDDSRYLQVSTPVQPGNSGGPLLDKEGNLVGIVSAKLNALKVMLYTEGDIPQNVNFAIRALVAANFLQTNNIKLEPGVATQAMQSPDLADEAKAMSVFVRCQLPATAQSSRE